MMIFEQPSPKYQAEYSKIDLAPRYHGHPYIEALPRFANSKSVMTSLKRTIRVDPLERECRASERIGFLADINQVFWPLQRDGLLFETIQANMFELYRSIAIEVPNFSRRVLNGRVKLDSASERLRPGILLVLGGSGLGKSTSINRCLSLIPRVIEHHTYDGAQFRVKQIPWLKVDYSYTNNTGAIVREIANSLYSKLYPSGAYNLHLGGKTAPDTSLDNLASDLVRHGTVVIVLDNTEQAISMGDNDISKTQSFLLNLVEKLAVLLIVVGTPELRDAILSDKRIMRRCNDNPIDTWDPISGEDWDSFIRNMWKCQFLAEPTPLTQDVKDTFFALTQGHPAMTRDLFKHAQQRAILAHVAGASTEVITPSLLVEVKNEFVRSGTWIESPDTNESLTDDDSQRPRKVRSKAQKVIPTTADDQLMELEVTATASLMSELSAIAKTGRATGEVLESHGVGSNLDFDEG